MSGTVMHIWVKQDNGFLTPTDDALVRIITDRYENGDGSELKPEHSGNLIVLHARDIRRKAHVKEIVETHAVSTN